MSDADSETALLRLSPPAPGSATRAGMSSHQSARALKDEWLTPPWILRPLGVFDLDPCAPVERPWDTALQHFTLRENGLARRWSGRVWLNPPYGSETGKWLRRLREHGNGIALIFARTETADWFDNVWGKAAEILFIKGRLHFYHISGIPASGNSGAPSALVAYGEENAFFLRKSGIPGALVGAVAGVSQNDQAERP